LQPEVSQKDFSNAVTTAGLTVPGLTTRRINTSVELRFGQTFMLGGLIEMQNSAQTFKLPWLGELPWVGAAFRRVSYQEVEKELVILVTPVLAGAMAEGQVPPGGPGMFTDTPTDRELYRDGMIEVPSYGDHCSGNCGNYPPPVVNFNVNRGPVMPLITPVPLHELPPGAPGIVPLVPTSPPPGPSKAPAAEATPPSARSARSSGTESTAGTSRKQGKVRQASAQTSDGSENAANRAGFSALAPTGSSTSGAAQGRSIWPPGGSSASSQSRSSGLYEPQSGLYAPASGSNR
jgi:pilus assembly protein CpaC